MGEGTKLGKTKNTKSRREVVTTIKGSTWERIETRTRIMQIILKTSSAHRLDPNA
jgi:hypothetical protein